MSEETPKDTYGSGVSPYTRTLMKTMGAAGSSLSPSAATFWGAEHPASLLNLVEDKVLLDAVARIPVSTFSLTEAQLAGLLPEGGPSRQDRRLRIEFWDAYERAAANLEPMDLDNMVQGTGVLHWESYRARLLSDQNLLAWFLSPPASYRVQMKEAMELGLSRLVEILQLPLIDPGSGKIRADVGALILQAYKLVDLRNNGAIAQKIVQLSADAGTVPQDASLNPDEIDRKLKELEAKLKGEHAPLPPTKSEPKDVVAEFAPAEPASE